MTTPNLTQEINTTNMKYDQINIITEHANLIQNQTQRQCNHLQTLDPKSHKIVKKRNKYHKIDDEIRLKIVEAVEKKGEMLKIAAKRFQINYSSAKSIFHTYRKEGRIIKKIVKDRFKKKSLLADISPNQNFNPNFQAVKAHLSPQYINHLNQLTHIGYYQQHQQHQQQQQSPPQLTATLPPTTTAFLGNPLLRTYTNGGCYENQINPGVQRLKKNLEALLIAKRLQALNNQQHQRNLTQPDDFRFRLNTSQSNTCNLPIPNNLTIPHNTLNLQVQVQALPQSQQPLTQNNFTLNTNPIPNSSLGFQAHRTHPYTNNTRLYGNEDSKLLKKTLEGHIFDRASQANLRELMKKKLDQPKGYNMESLEIKKGDVSPHQIDTTATSIIDDASTVKSEMKDEMIKPLKHILNDENMNTIKGDLGSIQNCLKNSSSNETLKGNIEAAAMDTIKAALNAQYLLAEAIKKATLLKNLMSSQSLGPIA